MMHTSLFVNISVAGSITVRTRECAKKGPDRPGSTLSVCYFSVLLPRTSYLITVSFSLFTCENVTVIPTSLLKGLYAVMSITK